MTISHPSARYCWMAFTILQSSIFEKLGFRGTIKKKEREG